MGHEICMKSRLRNGHKPCYVLFTDTKDLGKGIMQQPGCRPRPRTLPKQRNEVLHLGIIMRAHVQHVERDGDAHHRHLSGGRAGGPAPLVVRSFRSGEQEGHSPTEVTATGTKSQSSVDVVRSRLPSLDRSIDPSRVCCIRLFDGQIPLQEMPLFSQWRLQGSTNRRAPGCVNAAGKLRQKW